MASRTTCGSYVVRVARDVLGVRGESEKGVRVSAPKTADASTTSLRLLGLRGDGSQPPWVIRVEGVLVLDNHLVGRVHRVAPRAAFNLEDQVVPTVVPCHGLQANETGKTGDRTNVGIRLRKRDLDL